MNKEQTPSHTPGPWVVVTGKRGYPRSIMRTIENRTNERGGINTIIRWDGIGFPSSQEAQANARLIAAAPDLLGALKTIINAIGNNPVVNIDEAERLALAAIAKATENEAIK